MSESANTQKRPIATLIAALLAVVASAIGTQRTDVEALKKQKEEADEKIRELEEKVSDLRDELEDESIEDSELEGLRPQIEGLLAAAQAAKPPTEEQVGEVSKQTAPPAEPEE